MANTKMDCVQGRKSTSDSKKNWGERRCGDAMATVSRSEDAALKPDSCACHERFQSSAETVHTHQHVRRDG